jgi:ankyrin repeat protein
LTPLLLACGKTTPGYRVVSEALIAKGANLNVRDVIGNTPLLLAISGGRFDIAKLLVERGANISILSQKGESPLELAQRSKAPEALQVVNALLARLAEKSRR